MLLTYIVAGCLALWYVFLCEMENTRGMSTEELQKYKNDIKTMKIPLIYYVLFFVFFPHFMGSWIFLRLYNGSS